MSATVMPHSAPAGIPRIGPGRELQPNRTHRLRRQIVRPEDADRIMRLAIDHYVSGAPGEISAAVANRAGYAEEIVDAVMVAAFLEVRGAAAVRRHCDQLAVDMVRERAYDSRQEFQEWLKARVA